MSALPKLAKDRRLNVLEDLTPRSRDHSGERRYIERLLHDGRDARRFILGDEASFEVGKWIESCEDMLLDNLQFAKPPFERTYVELSIRDLNRGIGRATTGPDNESDDRLGFLIVGNHVRTIVSGQPPMRGVHFGAWEYWINTPDENPYLSSTSSLPSILKSGLGVLPPRIEWYRLMLLLGSTVQALRDEEQRLAICFGTRIQSTLPFMTHDVRHQRDDGLLETNLQLMARSAAGEMRTLWAVLLLVNQHRHKLSFHDMPRQVALTPRRRVYMAHTLITLPLTPAADMRRTYYPNTRASPIGHEVRGHWRRYHLHPHCIHAFPMVPDDNGHFVCTRCRGWRTWLKAFHRGNAKEGFDVHTYEVTP